MPELCRQWARLSLILEISVRQIPYPFPCQNIVVLWFLYADLWIKYFGVCSEQNELCVNYLYIYGPQYHVLHDIYFDHDLYFSSFGACHSYEGTIQQLVQTENILHGINNFQYTSTSKWHVYLKEQHFTQKSWHAVHTRMKEPFPRCRTYIPRSRQIGQSHFPETEWRRKQEVMSITHKAYFPIPWNFSTTNLLLKTNLDSTNL